MSTSVPLDCLFQTLRRRRYPLALMLLGALLISLASALAQCLVSDAASPSPFAVSAAADSAVMPCASCTVGSEARSLDDVPVVPATPAFGAVVALVLVSVLFTIAPLKSIPVPQQPLLPKRPRTLKFYALRI